MEYYCTKKELRALLGAASKIGYIKGLTEAAVLPKYVSKKQAYTVFTSERVRQWVRDLLITPKPLGNGKTSKILYEYARLVELDAIEEIKIRKPYMGLPETGKE